MSKEIDERVVRMEFDNEKFESNIKESQKSLENLDKTLGRKRDSNAFSGLERQLDSITVKFDMMSVAAASAMSRIVNKAMDTGEKIVKSLTVDNVITGWNKYEQKTKAVQTIMAATADQFSDTAEQMEFVNAQLDRLAWYADETSYSFNDMVGNVGKFTSNNIDLETSVTAMMGISNWAALSGANVNEASRAMYNLSQALSVGAVKLIDWKSIENANMATASFKDTALETAVSLGTLTKAGDGLYVTMKGNEVSVENFSSTLSDAWFTSDVLLQTLEKYGGYANAIYDVSNALDMTATETLDMVSNFKNGSLDIQEYAEKTGMSVEDLTSLLTNLSDEMFELGERSFRAGQEAKTFSEVIDSVKDAASSTWSKTFELIFGNYEQAKGLFTDMANELYDLIVEGSNQRNEMLQAWNDLGGRDILIEAFWNAWEGVKNIMRPIQEAFQEVFPPLTAKRLLEFTKKLRDLTSQMGLSEEKAQNLKDTFKGIFSIFGLAKDIVGTVLSGAFKVLGGVIGATDDSILGITGSIGRAITGFREWLQQSNLLNKGFTLLTDGIKFLTGKIGGLIDRVRGLKVFQTISENVSSVYKSFMGNFANYISGGLDAIELFKNSLKSLDGFSLKNIGTAIENFFKMVVEYFFDVDNIFGEAGESIKEHFKNIKEAFDTFVDSLPEKWKTITSSISNIFSTISQWVKALGTKYKVDWGKVFGIASLVGLGYIFAKTMKLMTSFAEAITPLSKAITTLTKGIASVPTNLGKAIERVGKGLKNYLNALAFEHIANGISSVAKSLVLLAAAAAVLAKLDIEGLNEAIGSIAMLAGIMAGLTLINALAARIANGKHFSMASLNLIGLATGIVILANAMVKLTAIPSERMWEVVGATTALIAALSVMAGVFNIMSGIRTKNFSVHTTLRSILSVVAVAGAVYIMVQALTKIQELKFDADALVDMAAGIGVAVLALLGAMAALRMTKVTSAIGVLLLTVAIQRVIGLFDQIMAIDLDKVNASIDKFKLVLIGLASVVGVGVIGSLFGKGKMMAIGVAAISLAGSIRLLVGVVNAITKIKDTDIKRGMQVVEDMLTLLTLVMAVSKIAGRNAARAGAMFLMMSVSIGILTGVIYALTMLDDSAVDRGTEVIAKIGAVFAGVMALSKFVTTEMKSLTRLIVAVGVLAGAIAVLSFLDPHGLRNATLCMTAVMGLFAVIELCSAKAPAAHGALVVLAVIVGEIGAILYLLSKADPAGALMAAISLDIALAGLAGVLVTLGRMKAPAKGAKSAMIILAVLMAEIGAILVLISSQEGAAGRAWSAAGAIDLVLGGIVGSLYILSKIKVISADALVGLGGMAIILAEIGIIFGLVLQVAAPWERVLALGAAIGVVMLALAASIDIIAIGGWADSAAIPGIVAMGIILAEIGIIFGLVLQVAAPWEQVLALGVGIGIVMLAFAASIDIIAIGGWAAQAAIPAMGAMMIVLAEVALIFGYLLQFDCSQALVIAVALGAVMIEFAIALDLLTIAGTFAAAAQAGATLLIEAVAVVGALVYALGALADEVEPFLDRGADILIKLGETLGQVIGGIIGGFFVGVTDGFPEIAANLSSFAENLKGFIEMAENIDPKIIDGVKSIVEAVDAVNGIDFDDEQLAKFSEQMPKLGGAMIAFNESVKDITNANKFKVISEGANFLSQALANLEGVDTSYITEDFCSGIEDFGHALNSFSISVTNLNMDGVEQAVGATESLAGLIELLPRINGAWQQFVGTKMNLQEFGSYLESYGWKLFFFGVVLKGITEEEWTAIDNATTATESLAGLIELLPRINGAWQKIAGRKMNFEDFGAYLKAYAESLSEASTIFAGNNKEYPIYWDAIDNAYEHTSDLAGIMAAFGDVDDVLAMASWQYMYQIAEGMSTISDDLDDVNWTAIDNLAAHIGTLDTIAAASLTDNIKKLAGTDIDFKSVKDKATKIAEAVAAVAKELGTGKKAVDTTAVNDFGIACQSLFTAVGMLADIDWDVGVDTESLGEIVKAIDEFSESCKNIDFSGVDQIKAFVDSLVEVIDVDSGRISVFNLRLRSLADAPLSDIATNFTNNSPAAVAAVEAFMDSLENAAEAGKTNFVAQFNVMAVNAVSRIRSQYGAMNTAGQYLVQGVINGIIAKKPQLISTAYQTGKDASEAMKHGMNEKSPSKDGEQYGEWMDEGVMIGFENKSEELNEVAAKTGEDASTSMGESMTESLVAQKTAIGDAMVEVLDGMVKAGQEYLEIEDVSNLARDEMGRYVVTGIAEGIEADDSPEEALKKKVDNMIKVFQDAVDTIDVLVSSKDLEYQLWEKMYPDATDEEKLYRKRESLDNQLARKVANVETLRAAWMKAVQMGADQKTVTERYNAFIQEQIDVLDMMHERDQLAEDYIKELEDAEDERMKNLKEHYESEYESWKKSLPDDTNAPSEYQYRMHKMQEELDAIDAVARMAEYQNEEAQKRLEEERQKVMDNYLLVKKQINVPDQLKEKTDYVQAATNAIEGMYQRLELLSTKPIEEILEKVIALPADYVENYAVIIDETAKIVNTATNNNKQNYYNSGYNAGTTYGQGWTNATVDQINNARSVIQNKLDDIRDTLGKVPVVGGALQNVWDKGSYVFGRVLQTKDEELVPKAIAAWYEDVETGVHDAEPILMGVAADSLANVANAATVPSEEMGNNISNGIANGILENGDVVSDAAVTVSLMALDAAKDALIIHSPSERSGDEIGDPFVEGIAKRMLLNQSAEDAARVKAASMIAVIQQELLSSGYDKINVNLGNISFSYNDEHMFDEYEKVIRNQQTKLGKLIDQYNDVVSRLGRDSGEATSLYMLIQEESATLSSLTKDLNKVREELLSGATSSNLYIASQEIGLLVQGGLLDAKKTYEATHKIAELSKTITKNTSSAASNIGGALADWGPSKWEQYSQDDLILQYAEQYDLSAAQVAGISAVAKENADKFGYTYEDIFLSGITQHGSNTGKDSGIYDQMMIAGENSGEAYIDGVSNAVEKYGSNAYEDIHEFAYNINHGVETEWDIHSPSRKTFEFMHMYMQGMIDAVDYYGPDVMSATQNMTNAVLDTSRAMAYAISEELDDPNLLTITPVLDMNNVDQQLRGFDAKQYDIATSLNLAADVAKSQNEKPEQVTNQNFNFTQNNTSPKALSRSEIYRQTNNQFSQFKQAVMK